MDKTLSDLTIKSLTHKYNVYNKKYAEDCQDNSHINEEYKDRYPGGRPQLLDALSAGCNLPYANSSFEKFTEEIENDVKLIVYLMPDTLKCIMGELRCRRYLTPLFIACFNDNVPIHIIEFLLQNGANPNDVYNLTGIPCKPLRDLEETLDKERYLQIKELFERYSLK